MSDVPSERFDSFNFRSPGIPNVRDEIEVLVVGPAGGVGVLLMHEISGVSPTCLDLAEDLAGHGFRVFIPVMFGRPGQEKRLDVRGLFCMRKEIHLFAANRTSPITQLLRRLVAEIALATERQKVGVIGMCLTGNLVFALVGESNVGAAVSSQPSLPLPVLGRFTPSYVKGALSVDAGDLMEAVRSRTPVLALRFSEDRLCPIERFESLERTFGDADALRTEEVGGKGHSVLTDDRPSGEADKVPLVVDFLTQHL